MIRPLALSLAAGMVLLTATLCGAAEIFPVVHNEPITVRILGGKDGQPLAHSHLVLLAGYDRHDLHSQLYRAELLTDAHGQAHLPKQLANLPWLQVWVANKPLCQSNPRGNSFSVDLIRRDGVSAPNLCGTATVEDSPGVFTVFVKSKVTSAPKEKNAPAVTLVARAKAPVVLATVQPAAVAPARKPAEAETRPPAAQIPAIPVAAALQEKPTPAPAEKVLKPTEPARPVAAAPLAVLSPVPVAVPTPAAAAVPTPAAAAVTAPAPAVVAASRRASGLDRVAAHHPIRRVSRRPASHRATPVSHSARPVSHRAKRVLASCEVRKPRAKAALPAASSARSEDKPATATIATSKSKPAAGIRMESSTPGKPNASPKSE